MLDNSPERPHAIKIDALAEDFVVIRLSSTLSHVDLVVEIWILDRELLGIHAHNRSYTSRQRRNVMITETLRITVFQVHILDLEDVFAAEGPVPVELIPTSGGRESRARKLGQR